MKRARPKLTYANVVSTLCLFLILGGGAYAGMTLPKNSVGTKQLRKNAVKGPKVANRSLTSADIRGAVNRARRATEADHAARADQAVSADRLAGSPASAFLQTSSVATGESDLTVPGGGSTDPLLTIGPLSLVAECENSGLAIYLRIKASTSAANARVGWGFVITGGTNPAGHKGLTGAPATLLETSVSGVSAGTGEIVYHDPSTTIAVDVSLQLDEPADRCVVDAVALRP